MQRHPRSDRAFWIALLVIVGLAAVLRLVGLNDRLHVGDDQARDLLTVKRSVETLHPFVVGPAQVANESGVVLGPFYYYLITPAAILANYHPLGPAVLIALLSVLAVAGIGWLGRVAFDPTTGLLAAFLLAVSSLAVEFGRFAWNPNPLPLVVVGIALGFWAWSERRPWGFPTTILLTVVATQLHSTGFLLVPIVLVSSLIVRPPRPSWPMMGWVMLGVGLLLAPLLYHEVKHDWPSLWGYLGLEGQPGAATSAWWYLRRAWDNLVAFFLAELVASRSSWALTGAGLVLCLAGLWQLRQWAIGVLFITLLTFGGLALALSGRLLFLHYFLFLIPAVIIGLAVGLRQLSGWRGGWGLVLVFLILFTVVHVQAMAPTWQAIGQADYPATEATSIVYPDVEAAAAWILADAGERSPELLFVKPTASHNQVAFDLAVERADRVVLEWDGILIPAQPADADRLGELIRTLSSTEPVGNHLDPLYVIVEPAGTPLPQAFQALPIDVEARFGQVKVLKVGEE
ncbi:hypothetical protein HY375_02455 [Candidatus Berkelbacteria bacterium]|nr:hypothetical protein [Candidatus Berkelbacteria bacterium]